ncbi:MAG: hypothetical protein IPP06_00005 [Saprospiraceae bacterium]|nr:hypothetical protein [Candidatus Vicinibacter affinis]
MLNYESALWINNNAWISKLQQGGREQDKTGINSTEYTRFSQQELMLKLYKFIQNYLENVCEIAKDKTNEKELLASIILDSIKYYFSAIDGCSNNYLDIRSATMKAWNNYSYYHTNATNCKCIYNK